MLAADLGSDVTFALIGGTAIGTGRGEQVAPVLGRGRYHWVLVAQRHRSVDAARLRASATGCAATPTIPDARAERPAMMQALRVGDVAALGAALHNDLQEAGAASLRRGFGEVLAAGMEYGALGGIVSGSGPTVAFLVDGPEGQLDLAVALTASGVARDVKRATGPVHGAHVVTTPRVRP